MELNSLGIISISLAASYSGLIVSILTFCVSIIVLIIKRKKINNGIKILLLILAIISALLIGISVYLGFVFGRPHSVGIIGGSDGPTAIWLRRSAEQQIPVMLHPDNAVAPDTANLKNAKNDNLVIFEDGDITSGQAVWDEFIEITEQGKPYALRLAFYYTVDGQGITPAHEQYEEIKDDYPLFFIQDLTFDGKIYTLYYVEDEKEYKFEYKYLKRFVEAPPREKIPYRGTIRYVLVNDKEVTWEQIISGMLSSRFDAWIDRKTVYTKHTWFPSKDGIGD